MLLCPEHHKARGAFRFFVIIELTKIIDSLKAKRGQHYLLCCAALSENEPLEVKRCFGTVMIEFVNSNSFLHLQDHSLIFVAAREPFHDSEFNTQETGNRNWCGICCF